MIRRKSAFKNLEEISIEEGPAVDPAFVPKVLYGHKSSLTSLVQSDLHTEARVLVLYTGGTIGMVMNENGNLAPIPHSLETRIRLYPHMHDSVYAAAAFPDLKSSPPLVLPDSRDRNRIAYWVYEYNPLLDSSNMTMDDWIRIASDIKNEYENFDGFVILHGTDTLGYTASALSFMMENLGKPIILTGSQIPLFETRSDGRDNFIGSLIFAATYSIPEVAVFFNNKLLRGNRTIKISSGSLDAFSSPNLQPLAVAGISIQVEHRLIFHSKTLEKFSVNSKLDRNVGLLRIFPSISTEAVRSFFQPNTYGVIIQTYGSGNIPSHNKELTAVLAEASKRGVIIVNITQCTHGSVQELYETSMGLREAGVIAGYDMTPEAALTKLAYVLSKDEWDLETKKKMMTKSLRGELTEVADGENEGGSLAIVDAIARSLQLGTNSEVEHIKEVILPNLFFASISNCDITRLNAILPHMKEINCKDISGWSGLHLAANNGSEEIVHWLLENGASVHLKNSSGFPPLWYAIQNGNLKVIHLLVQTGAHLSLSSSVIADHLVIAASNGNYARLRAFHAAGCDMSLANHLGMTALHAAVMVEAQDCIQFLLTCGVSPDCKDLTGRTPLEIAEMKGMDFISELFSEQLRFKRDKRRSVPRQRKVSKPTELNPLVQVDESSACPS